MQREGEDKKVAEMFYRVVVQMMLLFVSDSWVLSAAMEKTVEGTQNSFLCRIMGNLEWRITVVGRG